ncbi:Succinate dehydrogenase iron-sulfur subunit [Chlamydia pneumoniae]|uniref:succinate dehydrogenase n=3 Tax=Chlamydia pneumoniae TaxID=83558 RepID=A0A0F7WM69_CHLPN|nr:Succinate dehydrogenase iron-sulfur subunit [Chlamydia pneumoniae]CRI37299.1 Succinate dehydrogenase iron-sulfur subunit [Chlamydia pneumoniae]CRI38428.1 Succinate dehydrogenase iron-sulfur subunit [Chlamydia pneumoniae]CRI39560.1 Succinate dehydrogenase iron-sulfur subunit [Chlamydia pneumoniae]CRI40691.1 Succinate dehydrogenase iron-sulfur subunit [Chlamydia pneumoniae]
MIISVYPYRKREMMENLETFILKIYRGVPGKQYWESFELPLHPGENVISALMEIEKRPVNILGEKVNPVVWEQGCLEEVCGSCSILVNGVPRQACTALIQEYIDATQSREIVLAPLTKFPLIRDLIVDRSIMFDNLERIQGWVAADIEGETFGPQVTQEQQELLYALSQCMTCGCCTEACPQIDNKSDFIGPAAISQARYFNTYPGDKRSKKRWRALMGKGGIEGCGQAHNCVRVCPKKLPLTESISAVGREISKFSLRSLFSALFKKKK